MIDTIVLKISIPAISFSSDAIINRQMIISELKELLIDIATRYSHEYYFSSCKETIVHFQTSKILSVDKQISQYNILNGDKIVMI